MPKRIQRKRTKGWKLPENTVSIGRPGIFGNPYIVGEFVRDQGVMVIIKDKQHAVELFMEHLLSNLEFPTIKEDLSYLRGKDVACYCREDEKWCHGDVWLELANKEG